MRRLYSRLAALDSLRGFGILLVVLGHTSWSAGLVSWIFSFHMPLFFIISGMLFHERQFLDSFKRKAIRLLVPYVFFGTVTLAYWALIERRLRGDEGSVPNALANIVLARAGSDNYPQNAALWFLPCLFVTEMLFLGFFLLVNKTGSVETKTVMGGGWRNRIAVMALALVSFLSIIVMWSLDLPVDQFRLPWAFDILSFSMLFYCIGYLLSEFILPHVQQASQTQALAHIAFAVVGVAGLYLLWLFDGWKTGTNSARRRALHKNVGIKPFPAYISSIRHFETREFLTKNRLIRHNWSGNSSGKAPPPQPGDVSWSGSSARSSSSQARPIRNG